MEQWSLVTMMIIMITRLMRMIMPVIVIMLSLVEAVLEGKDILGQSGAIYGHLGACLTPFWAISAPYAKTPPYITNSIAQSFGPRSLISNIIADRGGAVNGQNVW